MPEHERRIVIVLLNARLVACAAFTGRTGLDDGWPLPRVVSVGHDVRRYLRLRFTNAEEHRAEIICYPRRSISAHPQTGGKVRATGSVEDDLLLCRAADAGKRDDAIHRVLGRRVWLAAQNGKRGSAVRPRETAIQRLIAVEGAHDVGTQIAQLHAISDLVARIDGVCQKIARLVEREIADVSDVDHAARRERDDKKVRAFDAARRRRRSAPRPTSPASRCTVRRAARRLGAVAVERDHLRLVAGEREAANLVELGLLTSRQIEDGNLVLRGTPLLAEALRLALRRIDAEGDEPGVAGDGERRARRGPKWISRCRGRLADREPLLGRAIGGLPDDDRRVSFVRRENVGKPLPIVRDRRRSDRFPRLEVRGGELLRPGGARGGSRYGGCLRLLSHGAGRHENERDEEERVATGGHANSQ